MKKLVVYALIVSSLSAQNIKALQYVGVTTEHERFDGTIEKFTVEREVDRLCIFIPISNETVWEGEYAGRGVPQRCIDTFVKGLGQIQPMTIYPGVETIAELEVLEFMEKMKHDHNLMLIDTRDESFYNYRTIPSATNLFYRHITKRATFPEEFDETMKTLGVVKTKDSYDFTHAKTIALFCNGSWCGQSPSVIKTLIALGYPPKKIKWYRGGMQNWLASSLTSTRP